MNVSSWVNSLKELGEKIPVYRVPPKKDVISWRVFFSSKGYVTRFHIPNLSISKIIQFFIASEIYSTEVKQFFHICLFDSVIQGFALFGFLSRRMK